MTGAGQTFETGLIWKRDDIVPIESGTNSLKNFYCDERKMDINKSSAETMEEGMEVSVKRKKKIGVFFTCSTFANLECRRAFPITIFVGTVGIILNLDGFRNLWHNYSYILIDVLYICLI